MRKAISRGQAAIRDHVRQGRAASKALDQIAHELGVSVPSLRHYMAGRRRPSARAAARLERLAGVRCPWWYEPALALRSRKGES